MLSVASIHFSCGIGHQATEYIIIYCCNLSTAWHTPNNYHGYLPDYRQLVMTPKDIKKVTKYVIE